MHHPWCLCVICLLKAELHLLRGGIHINGHGVAAPELTAEDALGDRCFQLTLDGALERARAVHRVVTHASQPIEGIGIEL